MNNSNKIKETEDGLFKNADLNVTAMTAESSDDEDPDMEDFDVNDEQQKTVAKDAKNQEELTTFVMNYGPKYEIQTANHFIKLYRINPTDECFGKTVSEIVDTHLMWDRPIKYEEPYKPLYADKFYFERCNGKPDFLVILGKVWNELRNTNALPRRCGCRLTTIQAARVKNKRSGAYPFDVERTPHGTIGNPALAVVRLVAHCSLGMKLSMIAERDGTPSSLISWTDLTKEVSTVPWRAMYKECCLLYKMPNIDDKDKGISNKRMLAITGAVTRHLRERFDHFFRLVILARRRSKQVVTQFTNPLFTKKKNKEYKKELKGARREMFNTAKVTDETKRNMGVKSAEEMRRWLKAHFYLSTLVIETGDDMSPFGTHQELDHYMSLGTMLPIMINKGYSASRALRACFSIWNTIPLPWLVNRAKEDAPITVCIFDSEAERFYFRCKDNKYRTIPSIGVKAQEKEVDALSILDQIWGAKTKDYPLFMSFSCEEAAKNVARLEELYPVGKRMTSYEDFLSTQPPDYVNRYRARYEEDEEEEDDEDNEEDEDEDEEEEDEDEDKEDDEDENEDDEDDKEEDEHIWIV